MILVYFCLVMVVTIPTSSFDCICYVPGVYAPVNLFMFLLRYWHPPALIPSLIINELCLTVFQKREFVSLMTGWFIDLLIDWLIDWFRRVWIDSAVMKMTDFYEDACDLSNSEPEADSDDDMAPVLPAAGASSGQADASGPPESWDDPQTLLNTWLGELDNLKEVSPSWLFPCYVLHVLIWLIDPFVMLIRVLTILTIVYVASWRRMDPFIVSIHLLSVPITRYYALAFSGRPSWWIIDQWRCVCYVS